MSICFVHVWNVEFFANEIADWLSLYMVILVGDSTPISPKNHQIQMASFVACARAIYSASVVERVTVGCHLLAHLMAALFMMNA